MIKRTTGSILIALMLVAMLSIPAGAEEEKGAGVDIDLEGYYRVRYDNHFNTGWVFDEDSDWYTYFDQRMLLTPSFIINEKIGIYSQLDILRNVNWGQNTTVKVPVAFVDRNETNIEKIESVQLGAVDLTKGNLFSAAPSNVDLATGEDVESIQVRRLWGEVTLPVGRVIVGRMGSNFGLGIFSNDGNGFDDDYGDTYDRIGFGTKIGPYVPIFLYEKIVEDSRAVADTDVNDIAWVNYLRDIEWGQSNSLNAGFYMLHRWQQSTDAKLFVYDLWAQLKMGGFRLETEAAAIQGKMTMFDSDTIEDLEENGVPTGEGGGKITADAYINANQFWYESDTWGTGIELGFSSPSDPNPEREFNASSASAIAVAAALNEGDEDSPQGSIDFITSVVENQAAFGTHIYTFPFDKDYSVDLIIWEMLMGGAVKNGIYAKVGGYINPIDMLNIRLDVLKSWINEPHKGEDGEAASHDLGWETDLDVALRAADHFTFGVQFAYAWPGAWFEDVYENVENVYTLQTRFIFDF
jgi:hypothetical protein